MIPNLLHARGTVSSAAPGALQADISGYAGEFTLRIKVWSLTAGKRAEIVFEDTVDNFAAAKVVARHELVGPVTPGAPAEVAITHRQARFVRLGTASAELRVNLSQLDGGGAIDYEASMDAWEPLPVA